MNLKSISMYLLVIIHHGCQSQDFILGGWLPYWRCQQSSSSALDNISLLTQISPFSYEMDNTSLRVTDPFSGKHTQWKKFFDTCRAQKITIIPTIFWTNTRGLHRVLAYKKNRKAHIDELVKIVLDNNFDGININYERVHPDDRIYFIAFIKSLSQRLHAKNRLLCCCAGGRTADTSVHARYPKTDSVVVKDGQFIGFNWSRLKNKKSAPTVSLEPGTGASADRYKKTLAEYCDQVHVMGYDEWGLPCKHSTTDLNACYYVSHCSNIWTEQIIDYFLSFIPAHKLILGIPTYGLEFDVARENEEDLVFKKIRNVTFPAAQSVLTANNISPFRSSGNEMIFTYKTKDESHYVCYPDAHSIKNKIDISHRKGLKGVYLFKIDGLNDPSLWDIIKGYFSKNCSRCNATA